MAANGGPSQRSMQGHQCIAGQLTRALSLLSALPSILFTAGRTGDSSHTIFGDFADFYSLFWYCMRRR